MCDKNPPDRESSIPGDIWERIERACNDFEKAHLSGEMPRISDFVPQSLPPRYREALLYELHELDQYLRSIEFPSQLLDTFDVLSEVGRGNMGVVYEVRHKNTGRRLALKTIPRRDPVLFGHIKDEYHNLKKISHPNIVQIEELAVQGAVPFVTMEYIDGIPLTDFVAPSYDSRDEHRSRNPVDFKRLQHCLTQLMDAVRSLHAADLIHRDIKPDNTLVTKDARVVLLDFGLAVKSGELASIRPTAGTWQYSSPEQQQGQWPLEAASDWYGVGVMLYECLTGRKPFKSTTLNELLDEKLSYQFPSPVTLAPGTPPDLDELCMNLLNPDAKKRAPDEVISKFVRTVDDTTFSPSVWIGREEPLQRLSGALESAWMGNPATVFVRGPSGIGKTALVNHFLKQCKHQSSAVILIGECFPRAHVPYKGFDRLIDALSNFLASKNDEFVRSVMPLETDVLCQQFEALNKVHAFQRQASLKTQEDRIRGFAALQELLSRLAYMLREQHHHLILFIDDLQWAGRDSVELFLSVFGNGAPACLTICAFREDGAQSEFIYNIDELARNDESAPCWENIHLEPLVPSECTELARRLLPTCSQAVVQSVADKSDGMPWWLRMVGEEARCTDDLSELSQINPVTALLKRTRPVERELLEHIAVVGRPLEETILAQVTTSQNLRSALVQLHGRRLLRTIETGSVRAFDVYHDKIREAVRSQLSPRSRKSHARRLIAAFASSKADPELLARLHLDAGNRLEAAGLFASAGRKAQETLAFNEAISLFNRALEHHPPSASRARGVQLALAECLGEAGYGEESARMFLEVAQQSPSESKSALELKAALRFLTSGHITDGLSTLKAVLHQRGIRYWEKSFGVYASILWQRLLLVGAQFGTIPRTDVSQADRLSLDAYWAAVAGLSTTDPVRAADFTIRFLRLSLRVGDSTDVLRALSVYAGHVAAAEWKSRRQSMMLLDTLERIADEDGRPYAKASLALARGVTAHLQCRYPDSVRNCDQAEKLLADRSSVSVDERLRDVEWELGVARSFSMWALMYMGQLRELKRRQPERLQIARKKSDRFASLNFGTQVQTYVLLGADKPGEAREYLERDKEELPGDGFFVQHLNYLIAMASLEKYCRNGIIAYQHMTNCWDQFASSTLYRVQHMRIDTLQALCRAMLSAAQQEAGSERRRLISRAKWARRKLRAERTPWAVAASTVLRACISSIEERNSLCDELRLARDRLQGVSSEMFAAAAEFWLTDLEDGDSVAANRRFERLGVNNPQQMTAALLPGYSPES